MTTKRVYGSSTVRRHRRSQSELAEVDEAIAAAVAEEHPVSLRGVYYRVVSAGAVEKTEDGYRLVGGQLLKLRRDRVIPYWQITAGTRYVIRPNTHVGLQQMLDDAAASYRRQLWRDQAVDVQLFTEKDATTGVIEPVADQWDVPLGVLRGYGSESFAYNVAESVRNCGKPAIHIFQLGDHDPSGVDAWRAFRERVASFLGAAPVTAEMAATTATHEQVSYKFLGGSGFEWDALRTVTFARIAVTEDQITEMGLPTRPTKNSDTRAAKFTGGSVEVDAIRPSILRQLVEDAITSHIDPEALRLHREIEAQERAGLAALAGQWSA